MKRRKKIDHWTCPPEADQKKGVSMGSSLKWITVILGVSAFGTVSLASTKEIEWKKLDEALSSAKSQKKQLLIDFYSPT